MGRGIQGEACRRLGRSPSLNVRVTWSTAWPRCSDKMQRSQTERTVHPHQSHGGERCCVLTGVEWRTQLQGCRVTGKERGWIRVEHENETDSRPLLLGPEYLWFVYFLPNSILFLVANSITLTEILVTETDTLTKTHPWQTSPN